MENNSPYLEEGNLSRYLRFTSMAPISCRWLKEYLESNFHSSIDFILNRVESVDFCTSGYFCLETRSFEFEHLSIEKQTIHFKSVSERTFHKKNVEKVPRLHFESVTPYSREELISYFSEYGRTSALVMTGLPNRANKPVVTRGFVDFVSCTEAENYLLNAEISDEDFRIVKIDKLKGGQGLKPVDCNEKNSSWAEEGTQNLDLRPKLVFDKPKPNLKRKSAFGGFFIRPYLKSAEIFALNSAISSNIRLNLLTPNSKGKVLDPQKLRGSQQLLHNPGCELNIPQHNL